MKQFFLAAFLIASASYAFTQRPEPDLDNNHNSTDGTSFTYRDITPEDLEQVRKTWASRDLSAKAVEVVIEEKLENHTVLIVKHEVMGRIHYGAIALPHTEDYIDTPVRVILDGLDQEDPAIRMLRFLNFVQDPSTAEFIAVIPAFRGRTLQYREISLFAEGDFCDAFDGATDDAIAMLNVAQTLYPQANFSKVLAGGGSRGGTTALLMGVRDSRVNTVGAGAAPVNFYREDLRIEYDDQYICWFFNGKSETESRQRMLASSPLYFAPNENLQNVFLSHGEQDEIVPLWNPIEMSSHLERHDVDVATYIYPETDHSNWYMAPSAQTDNEAGTARFLSNIEND